MPSLVDVLPQCAPLFRTQAGMGPALALFMRTETAFVLPAALGIRRLVMVRTTARRLAGRLGRGRSHPRRKQRTEEKTVGNTFHHDRR